MSSEQQVIYLFFKSVFEFSYDKAKEISDRDRDFNRIAPSTPWHSFLSCLAQLAVAEKSYMSLSFLLPKGFLRKDANQVNSLTHSYETIKHELKRLVDISDRTFHSASYRSGQPSSIGPAGSNSSEFDQQVFAHLTDQLVQFCQARIELMSFYEKMNTAGISNKAINYEDMLIHANHILQHNNKNFIHPLLSPLKNGFSFECEILCQLLNAQISIVQWKFLPSLLFLHEANAKLVAWGNVVQSKETRRLSFSPSFLKASQIPALYQWLMKFKGGLISKFSLYFYDVLSKQTTLSIMKSTCSKAQYDFHYKLTTFYRKSDALSICLVLDTQGVEDYRGAGYHHPDFSQTPKGLESYPAIFCHVSKPSNHWPSIVMIMNENMDVLNNPDRIAYFYDKNVDTTYFLIKVESNIVFVAVFPAKKSEKDSYITGFLTELATQLKCNKIFLSLRPGSK